MIRRLIDVLTGWLKGIFPPTAVLEARGGGPALDRALDNDEISIAAAERGLTGRDRDDWLDRQADQQVRLARRITQADVGNDRPFRISDVLYPKGNP